MATVGGGAMSGVDRAYKTGDYIVATVRKNYRGGTSSNYYYITCFFNWKENTVLFKSEITNIGYMLLGDYIYGNNKIYSITDLTDVTPIETDYNSIYTTVDRLGMVYDYYLILAVIYNGAVIIYDAENPFNLKEIYRISSTEYVRILLNNSYFMFRTSSKAYIGTFYDKDKHLVIKDNFYYNTDNADVTSKDVIYGKKFYTNSSISNNLGQDIGTMPDNGELNYTSSIEDQAIPEGYTLGGKIAAVDSSIDNNIIPEYIKSGVTILGVEGTLVKNDGNAATSDANVQARYLLEGYSAVMDDTLIQGTMKNYGTTTIEPNNEDIEIPTGYYDSLTISVVDASILNGYDECLQALEVI